MYTDCPVYEASGAGMRNKTWLSCRMWPSFTDGNPDSKPDMWMVPKADLAALGEPKANEENYDLVWAGERIGVRDLVGQKEDTSLCKYVKMSLLCHM